MTTTPIAAPYLIYLGDTPMAELAKTGAGLAFWRPSVVLRSCANRVAPPIWACLIWRWPRPLRLAQKRL